MHNRWIDNPIKVIVMKVNKTEDTTEYFAKGKIVTFGSARSRTNHMWGTPSNAYKKLIKFKRGDITYMHPSYLEWQDETMKVFIRDATPDEKRFALVKTLSNKS